MDLDDLLADLQSALPPEQQVSTPTPPPTSSRQQNNGHADINDHFYDHTSHLSRDNLEYDKIPEERGSLSSNRTSIIVRYYVRDNEEASADSPFDDAQYCEVRKGPLYVPGERSAPTSVPPEQHSSPPPSKPPRDSLGAFAGLSELDNLLEMLNDTQTKIEQGVVRSATMMPIKYKKPLTEEILRIGRDMSDPRASDLNYLFEEAKVLHQKMMALTMEEIDLKKVGILSSEVLLIQQSKPVHEGKMNNECNPKTMIREMNKMSATLSPSSSQNLSRSLMSLNTLKRSLSISVSKSYRTVSRTSSDGSKKPKSTKRSIFSFFGLSKSQKKDSELSKSQRRGSEVLSNHHSGELSRSLEKPRHSIATTTLLRKSTKKVVSLSRPASPKEKQTKLIRSSSLDILDNDVDLSYESNGTSPFPSLEPSMRNAQSLNSLLSDNSDDDSPEGSHFYAISSLGTEVGGRITSRRTSTPTVSSEDERRGIGEFLARKKRLGFSRQKRETRTVVIPSTSEESSLRASPNLLQQHRNGSPLSSPPVSPKPKRTTVSLRPTATVQSLPLSIKSPPPVLPKPKRTSTSRSLQDPPLDIKSPPPVAPKPKHYLSRVKSVPVPNSNGSCFVGICTHNSGGYTSSTPVLSSGEAQSSLPCHIPSTIKKLRQNSEIKSASSSSLDPRATRPSVATLVNELTQVEQQVGGGTDDSFDSPKHTTNAEGGSKHRTNITASSATLELDELMQNLEEFEPPAQNPSSDYDRAEPGGRKPKSAMDNLSNMLGSLEQDMENIHGVSTVAKGMCAACRKPILAKVLDALGRQWHPEHFTCAACDMELSNATYYESNGRPYCEKDYHELYAPRCAYCNGPILERVMRALDKTWHPEHFFCTLCGKKFGSDGFHEKDSKAYCRECYYENYAPSCKRCGKAIMEGFITALNAQWHPECFSCKVCNVTFPRGNYFEHEGEPHCELHYHASRGTLCASCQKPVTGKCVTAMGKKWHPEHFTCAFCLKLLNKGTFKEHRQNPYCQPCYIKLFG